MLAAARRTTSDPRAAVSGGAGGEEDVGEDDDEDDDEDDEDDEDDGWGITSPSLPCGVFSKQAAGRAARTGPVIKWGPPVERLAGLFMPNEPSEDTHTSPAAPPPAPEDTSAPYLIVLQGTRVGELHKLAQPRLVVGRGETADIQLTADEGVSREHTEILVDGPRVTIRDLGSRNGTYCNGARVDTLEVADGDKIVVGSTTMLKFSHQQGIERSYWRDLHKGAARDASTRALRREFFLERLEGEVAFALRHATPLAVVMWDLDRLAAVNDQYGQAAGDRVLTSTARTVSGAIRREDIFARYGGEEFAVACRATNMARAFRVAERLREAISDLVVTVGEDRLRVSASFGVAVCPNHGVSGAADLMAAADAAVSRAKIGGRNRTEIAG